MKHLATFFVTLCLLLTGGLPMKAQIISPLSDEFKKDNGLVDPPLASINSLGMLPVGNQKWPIYFVMRIVKPEPVYNYYGEEIYRTYTDKKTGKKISYNVYENPYIYYAILDNPDGSGRYYGLITTGYDSIDDVVKKSSSTWHPFTEVILLNGTLVKQDGTQETYVTMSKAERDKIRLSKPSGSFWVHDKLGFQDMNFLFNQNGTGTITADPGIEAWTLQSRIGGIDVWMHPIVKKTFKWRMDDEGLIKITPTGTTIVELTEGMGEPDQYYSSSSDKAIHKRQLSSEFKTNPDAQSARKFFKAMPKNTFDIIDEITIQPYYMLKDEMMGFVSAKTSNKGDLGIESFVRHDPNLYDQYEIWYLEQYEAIQENRGKTLTYFSGKKLDYDDEGRTMNIKGAVNEILHVFYKMALEMKPNGAEITYDRMVKSINQFVANHSDIFGSKPSYMFYGMNPDKKTAFCTYVKDNEPYNFVAVFRDDFSISEPAVEQSMRKFTILDENIEKLTAGHEKIMAHKDDSNLKKEIKDYEKEYKKVKLKTQVSSIQELRELDRSYKQLIKKQEEILNRL